jgi:hypothetical protein
MITWLYFTNTMVVPLEWQLGHKKNRTSREHATTFANTEILSDDAPQQLGELLVPTQQKTTTILCKK